MAKNFVAPGDMLQLTAPYNVTSGQGFQVGNIFAVAQSAALAGAAVQGHVEGVYDLTKAAGVVIAQGSRVFWDNTALAVTNVATGNIMIGVATAAAASGDGTVRVDVLHVLTGADLVRASVATLTPTTNASTAFTLTLPRCHILALHERTTTAFTGATVQAQLGTTAGAADIAQVMDEVESEAVIIVDQQDHDGSGSGLFRAE
jgi:predicted RecA/RadA family phage recombinase